MIILYRIIINLIFTLSPIIIIFRLMKKKEDLKRFKEKFCFFSKKRGNGKLLWFHGASVGEIQSIVPLLEKLEKNKSIKKILITSNTLSSSKILEKMRLKKIIHQFFPIDTNIHTKKFLNYWKPSCAFFIDSEIWPNTFMNLKKKNIPIILLNGRITKKSFLRWKKIPSFSKKIFSNFSLCLSSNNESKNYLKKLGATNIKFIGNLKFSQSENEKLTINNNLRKFIFSKKTWCASSTHDTEEKFCGLVHKKLKKKYKNLLTIIIPRHIDRTSSIENELNKLNLKTHTYESNKKINKETDVYIVDAYGKTKSIYSLCKNVFLGGSLIKHGGQNPLEASRYGCNILHGPNIFNFTEIYNFLSKNKISQKIDNENKMTNSLDKLFLKKTNSKQIQKKLNGIGQKVLVNTYKEVKLLLKNDI
jgi:3-deoxy-D-manno-octulosonic-acid transferase